MGGGQRNVWSLPGMEKKRRFDNGALETVLHSKHLGTFNKWSALQKSPPQRKGDSNLLAMPSQETS